MNRIFVELTGGHGLLKTRAAELGVALADWATALPTAAPVPTR